jgi:RNA polymerase sigma-70 factor, ECF subfamily
MMTTQIDQDGSLVAALRRGDPTAAEDLVAVYGDRACRLATRITRNAPDAEEAVQDAFLSVIRKIDSFRGDATFGSWVYRIVANAAYQCCRKRRRHEADVSLDNLLPAFDGHGRHVAPVTDWSWIVDDPARHTELRMVLSTAIEELPADYRAVVVLRDVEGFSHREIAESLGLTVVNVKMRVHRARLFLRKRLAAHFSLAGVESMPSVAGSIDLEMRAPAPRDMCRSYSTMRPAASLATSSRDLRRACAI